MVKFLNLHSVNARFESQFKEAFQTFLDSGQYILGQEVDRFETDFASYCGTKYCLGVSNGRLGWVSTRWIRSQFSLFSIVHGTAHDAAGDSSARFTPGSSYKLLYELHENSTPRQPRAAAPRASCCAH